jgi:hypothetical protein
MDSVQIEKPQKSTTAVAHFWLVARLELRSRDGNDDQESSAICSRARPAASAQENFR